ncbi:SGNH/GDSL hydrolase family protein [Pseudotabrizicola algicola]|uniref:SGNH/GDSL hydrolase family protein n=1 Tax=Pseudotabrizicola algicola TaxID=2709381 RepID=A0A6B3RRJ2_9RHOB|nr:SGNH/GDSL hydrolase family protein [Pseudotabrizicola algicola]NEX47913.1 SGNH/GDSL hydrolase family protein [Pseudotabrizicola algicola]
MRVVTVLCLVLVLCGCGLASRQTDGDILVIGDSVLAWNRGAGGDVGRVISAELRREVVNHAALGARLGRGGIGRFGGLNIPAQLPPGRWNWVVMNGGANDLGLTCGCTRCEAEIDRLISKDGRTGVIPDLISAARGRGARVLWAGYYAAPQSRSFRGCRPGLVELERRIALHAQMMDGVFFVDSEDVFDASNTSLFAADNTHPSVEGSAVIGRYLARQIAARTPR